MGFNIGSFISTQDISVTHTHTLHHTDNTDSIRTVPEYCTHYIMKEGSLVRIDVVLQLEIPAC